MTWPPGLQRPLEAAGFGVAALLLVKFAIDFSREMNPLLAAPFWLLLAAALGIGSANLLRPASAGAKVSGPLRALAAAAIPLGFFASSLDCTGLELRGCSSFCTLIKLGLIPLLVLAAAAYFFTSKGWLMGALTLASLLPLAPHCTCANVANAWWIAHLGASPVCYAWGLLVALISVGALRTGRLLAPSIAVCFAIISGAAAFFISHHYFHFPW